MNCISLNLITSQIKVLTGVIKFSNNSTIDIDVLFEDIRHQAKNILESDKGKSPKLDFFK
jgi:hypothetical protein